MLFELLMFDCSTFARLFPNPTLPNMVTRRNGQNDVGAHFGDKLHT